MVQCQFTDQVPPPLKLSNHSTWFSTQRRVHKLEVRTRTCARVLTCGKLVTAGPDSVMSVHWLFDTMCLIQCSLTDRSVLVSFHAPVAAGRTGPPTTTVCWWTRSLRLARSRWTSSGGATRSGSRLLSLKSGLGSLSALWNYFLYDRKQGGTIIG